MLSHPAASRCSPPASPVPPGPCFQSRHQPGPERGRKSRSGSQGAASSSTQQAIFLLQRKDQRPATGAGEQAGPCSWKGMDRPGCSEAGLGQGGAAAQGGLASGSHPQGCRHGRWQQQGCEPRWGRRQGQAGLAGCRGVAGECPATGTLGQPRLRFLKTPPPGAVGRAVGALSVLFLQKTKLSRRTPETRPWREPSRCAGTGKELHPAATRACPGSRRAE